ncbi:MAG: hypothetical protein IPH07_39855 [Deltaproteobacteria bacterium]|nr:hypothetical protein [Deltaproteobacteria bacterium]MBK8713986.1 hypothetical protein [Deltaproteobacteria bacterium]MBP7291383.1 hypothetical protein [Nannocystaceae bacterium]
MKSSLTPAQRRTLGPRLRAYGSGWDLANLEQFMDIRVSQTPKGHQLTLTMRGASGLRSVYQLDDENFSGELLQIPPGDELTAAQLADVEAIIRAHRTLWIHRPEGRTVPVDVSRGMAALIEKGPRQTRLRGRHAVVYSRASSDEPTIFVLAVDLTKRRVTEAAWYDVPPHQTGLIPPEDIAVIDTAMRRHGDFGVYGSVTAGLVTLAKTSTIVLQRQERDYWVQVLPPGGHGHEFAFRVDLKTATISGASAGHSVEAE